jgi:hypothetical protein
MWRAESVSITKTIMFGWRDCSALIGSKSGPAPVSSVLAANAPINLRVSRRVNWDIVNLERHF